MGSRLEEDARQHERYPVDLRVDDSSHEVLVASRVTNLSRGGLFVARDEPLPLDALVQLTLTLPDAAGEIRALARVVWNHDRKDAGPLPPGMGIRFLSMSHQNWKRLIEFLAGLAPEAGRPDREADRPPR